MKWSDRFKIPPLGHVIRDRGVALHRYPPIKRRLTLSPELPLGIFSKEKPLMHSYTGPSRLSDRWLTLFVDDDVFHIVPKHIVARDIK